MNTKIIDHFQHVDPILASLIEKVDLQPHIPSSDYFLSLCDSIISQQLSEKAGATIYRRFEALFPKGVTPGTLLAINEETLRGVGMSYSKARYVKNLAQKVHDKEIILEALKELPNEEAMKELIKLKGIGPWTAEMFLMFSLGREDIFSYGDVGLQRAIGKWYGFKKTPTVKQMEKITTKWSPYRTYACRILWKSLAL